MGYLEEYQKRHTEQLFQDLEDEVLDEYNKGTISKIEMKNILYWCEDMKRRIISERDK